MNRLLIAFVGTFLIVSAFLAGLYQGRAEGKAEGSLERQQLRERYGTVLRTLRQYVPIKPTEADLQ